MNPPAPVAECEFCGARGEMGCRYERYVPEHDLWQTFHFCDGHCAGSWLRLRNRLPDLGITTSFSVAHPEPQTDESDTD